MTLFEYNCGNILVLILCITALCFFIYKIIKKHNKLNCSDNIIKVIIISITVLACSISSAYIVENDVEYQEGTVTECIRMGSIGDYIVNYTVYVIDDNGDESVYNTPVISNRRYKNKLERVNKNDKIVVKYGAKLHYAFDIEIIE